MVLCSVEVIKNISNCKYTGKLRALSSMMCMFAMRFDVVGSDNQVMGEIAKRLCFYRNISRPKSTFTKPDIKVFIAVVSLFWAENKVWSCGRYSENFGKIP